MKANSDKCHVLLSTRDRKDIMVCDSIISNSACEKLLGVHFDCDLSFTSHINHICKVANQKLHALSRVSNYMSFSQRKLLLNAFFLSQFNYCPLVWMCHNRELNNKINRLHERVLRMIYKDYVSSFDDLLVKDNSHNIHGKNIRHLIVEMFKVRQNIAPDLFKEFFMSKNCEYNLRQSSDFLVPSVKSTSYGLSSISYLGPRLWNSLPNDMKNATSISTLKSKLKNCKELNCPCRLCKVYLQSIGFM